MNSKWAIITTFAVLFFVALDNVRTTRKLKPYMGSTSWTIRRWAFVLLMVAQVHGIVKTIWSDHHFNVQDFLYFAEVFVVYLALAVANRALLRDWKRFPMFSRVQADIKSGDLRPEEWEARQVKNSITGAEVALRRTVKPEFLLPVTDDVVE